MRTTIKSLLMFILTATLILSLAITCFAAAENGKITVILEDKEKNPVTGTTVNICQIAELNSMGYYPAEAFENAGISISGIVNNPDEAVAKTIAEYIKKNNVSTTSLVSEYGKAIFSDLGLGIWFVFPDENSKYTFNPYIVFLPYESSGKLYYEVSSAPKVQDSKPDEISIYVLKKWDDKNNAAKKRPDFVTIELLNRNTVIETVELSESNGWAYTFSSLPKDGNYSVREKNIADYKVSYSGDIANGFIVTNTYAGEKLPQTGQYWWPIVIIAIAGIAFVLLGIYEIGVKKNGKKK